MSNLESAAARGHAEPKAEFDLLFKNLCDYQNSLFENGAKVAGFLLLAMGWFATAPPARKLLQATPNLRNAVILALALVGSFASFMGYRTYRSSQETLKLLDELGYLPPSHYARRVIDRPSLGAVIGGILVLALLACYAVAFSSVSP